MSRDGVDRADGSWMIWAASGIGGIWLGVALVSIFAPDLVSGSEQQHLPLPAFTTWLWGLISTGVFLAAMARLRGDEARRPIWIGLSVVVLVIWLAATIFSIALPVVETGSDPTRLPLGALIAPVAAALLTAVAGFTAAVFTVTPSRR